MIKTALNTVMKRHWGLVAAIVTVSGVSEYRHEHAVSVQVLGLSLLVGCLALLVVAVPLEVHKLRGKRQD